MDKHSTRVATKIILLSQLLNEAIDEAEGTTFYNQSLKNLIRKVSTKLDAFNRRQYDSIYNENVAEGIDVLDTVIDELTHCEIEGYNSIDKYNLYMVKDANGNAIKVKSTLEPDAFRKAYCIKTK